MRLKMWWHDTSVVLGSLCIVYGLILGLQTAYKTMSAQLKDKTRAEELAQEIDTMGDGYEWRAEPKKIARK